MMCHILLVYISKCGLNEVAEHGVSENNTDKQITKRKTIIPLAKEKK